MQIRGIQGGSDDFPAQSEEPTPILQKQQAEDAEESSDFDDGRDLQKLVEQSQANGVLEDPRFIPDTTIQTINQFE